MDQLDFATLQRIREAVAQIDTTDLVGVWSASGNEQLLFIYNAERKSTVEDTQGRAITLKALADRDDFGGDGLLVGIAALGLLPPYPLTKGPRFYPLERLLDEIGQRPLLYGNLYRLARTLLSSPAGASGDTIRRYQTRRKALQLALPYLVSQHNVDDLVAIVPGQDLGAFIDDRAGCWLGAGDDLRPLSTPGAGDWIVALEELDWLSAAITPESGRFVSLRSAYLRSRWRQVLKTTCGALARRFGERSDGSPQARFAAYQLMVESWLLGDEDAEDLVAIFPHVDFGRFAETGDALRVYRSLKGFAIDTTEGPNWGFDALLTKPLPDAYQSFGFALVALDKIPGPGIGRAKAADLGPLLRQTNHDTALAQTMLMLASDLVESRSGESGRTMAEAATDLAQRAWVFISLGDPWLWRHGRYGQLLASAATVLENALRAQAETDSALERDYHLALVEWYGCAKDGDNIERRLERMGKELRSFQRGAERTGGSTPARLATAEKLLDIEHAVLYPDAGSQQDQDVMAELQRSLAPDTRGYLRNRAASWGYPTPAPTPVFQKQWRDLRRLHQERQNEQRIERDAGSLKSKSAEIMTSLLALNRRFYAPPQETAILRFLAAREIAEVRLHREKAANPQLRIQSLSPYLEQNQDITWECEIVNLGRTTIEDIELVLQDAGPDFELLSSPVCSFQELPPDMPQRFSYRLRVCTSDEVNFRFLPGYAGLHSHEDIETRVPVRAPAHTPFRLLRNPFNTGDIISDPAQFYGREKEMEVLLGHLAGGRTNFLLQGPRRMGKSSMLAMVEQAVKRPGIRRRFDIPMDWDESLDAYVTVKLSFQGFNAQKDASHIGGFFRALVEEVARALDPTKRAQTLADFRALSQTSDPQRAAAETLNHLLAAQPHMRVLVLLDEYDELYKPMMGDLDAPLRYVVQHAPSLTWIIATTRLLVEHSKYYGSPWHNVLHQVRLDCLPREAAGNLIIGSSHGVGVEWHGNAIVKLMDETGRHPFYLQLFCSQVIDTLNSKRQNYVHPDLIADLIDDIVSERTMLHASLEPLWGGDISGVGQLIMLIVEWNEGSLTKNELREEVRKHLFNHFGARVNTTVPGSEREMRVWWELAWENGLAEVVEIRNALQFDGAKRTCSFAVPLFRRWLQRKDLGEDLWMAVRHKIAAELP